MILAVNLNPAIDKVYSVRNYAVGGVFRPDSMTATAGGKGLNVARVASIIGERVISTGFLGGSTGEFIEREVTNQGIESQFIKIDGESRICIAVMDKENNTSTEILEPGPEVKPKDMERFLKNFDELLDKCDIVTASGSLPLGLPLDFYSTLVEMAVKKHKKFILDSSGEAFINGVKSKPYMIKPNQEEMENILSKIHGDKKSLRNTEDKISALFEFSKMGIEVPCMTLGGDGAVAVIDGCAYKFTAPPIQVLNTVGSGDSFVAGCAAALSRGNSTVDSIKLGMACGMANTQFLKTGMVTVELVAKFYQQIKYEKL